MSKLSVNEITDEQGTGRPAFSNGVQTSNINGGQVGGRRNLIINGAMQVWQRGTSSTGALNNEYASADRWNFNTRDCSTRNISQQEFTVGQSQVPGNPLYFLRGEFSNDSGTFGPFIMQRVEGVQTGAGQTLILSFFAKADSTQTIEPKLSQQFNSASSNVDIDAVESSVTVDTNWQKYSVTFNVPSIAGKTVGSSSYLRADFRFPANTAIVFDIVQVQLEVGETATEFEHRSYGEELALCQRYFYRFDTFNLDAHPMWAYQGNKSSTRLPFPTTMRVQPSVSIEGSTTSSSDWGVYNDGSYQDIENISTSKVSTDSFRVNVELTSGVNGSDAVGLYTRSSNAGLTADAEL